MTRRKKLAISVVAILALAGAGVVAVVSLTPTMRSKFAQLREGMTYDEVVAILGEPYRAGVTIGAMRYGHIWIGPDSSITAFFDHANRLIFEQFDEAEPPGFLDRVLSWFGL